MHISFLLILVLIMSPVLSAYPAHGQVVSISSPFGMGFSVGSVSPIADGIPVYTIGDQLWVESYSGGPVTVDVANAAGTIVASSLLESMSPMLLYNFSTTDRGGNWELLASFAEPGFSVASLVTQFPLVGNEFVLPGFTGYTLAGEGQLEMNFTMGYSDSYDIGACIVGSDIPVEASVPIPGLLGSGQLEFTRVGSQVTVGLSGDVTTPFTFWIELHSDYSFIVSGNSTLVSRDFEVASSNSVDVAAGFTGATATLSDQMAERTGRFSMWVFFESSQGLSVYETTLLLPGNGSWIPLDGCSAAASNLAPAFTLSVSLEQNASAWPREIYTMYELNGVEMFSETQIPVTPAEISVRAAGWGKALTDSVLTLLPESGVDEVAVGDGTFFLTAAEYPLNVSVSQLAGEPETFTISQPFSTNELNISSGKVFVQTMANGKPVSGVGITLSESGQSVADAPSTDGEATFYVPVGNYTITGTYDNSTVIKTIDAQAGVQSSVSIDFAPTLPGTQPLLYVLASTAVLGVVVSSFVWVRAYQRRPTGNSRYLQSNGLSGTSPISVADIRRHQGHLRSTYPRPV